eukprot:3682434-Rhodomonas_salina.4
MSSMRLTVAACVLLALVGNIQGFLPASLHAASFATSPRLFSKHGPSPLAGRSLAPLLAATTRQRSAGPRMQASDYVPKPKPVLDTVNFPSDLKSLSMAQLKQLSYELRWEVIESVSKTGGHLSSSLGVTELTVALHYVFDAPVDKIVWDVAHQVCSGPPFPLRVVPFLAATLTYTVAVLPPQDADGAPLALSDAAPVEWHVRLHQTQRVRVRAPPPLVASSSSRAREMEHERESEHEGEKERAREGCRGIAPCWV